MGVFEHFPYANFHDLNLNWILMVVKKVSETVGTYDEHLAHLDSEIIRVEGEIPDVVQGPGSRTDAVMSQKAVTDAIASFAGVRSIENYHQDRGRISPVRFFDDDRVYRFDDGHVGDFETVENGSCARFNIDDADSPYIIITCGYGDPADTRQLAAAAAFDVEIPTPSTIPLAIWTVPASGGNYEIPVDLPGGTICVLVNDFDNHDPGLEKVLSGVWEWDGQPNNSVGENAIIDGAVVNAKIADGAVTSDKIADGVVTSRKIADSAILSRAFSGAARAPGVRIETITPAESMADNGYKITLLDSEPSTKYPGWVYLIKE